MYSKIALGNVKKSFKDYTIYFLTLTLAVCIFYTFTSIESQKAVMELNSGTQSYLEILTQIIAYVSVFVSIILGGLILYASNFLIKKRKKELGIYMTLGMGKGKISRILVLETLIVGTMSLISGLLLGIILSQGLSVFTAKLFDVAMSDYKFIISTSAIGKTILYFGIIFLLVMMFNTVIISRYKIIDLLTAGRKNENIKFKNPIIYLITFILCLASLGYAYYLVLKVGLDPKNVLFAISIGLGVLGTLLFFFSLAEFSLYITKRNKKVYFKSLNIFIIKQLNSKINTNFISMTVICLMLFLTMGILSTGISFKNSLEASLKDTTPFDATGIMYLSKDDKIKSIEQSLNSIGFNDYKSQNYSEYYEYNLGESIDSFINANTKDKKVLDSIGQPSVRAISISQYNDLRKLDNKEKSSLNDNEILITSNNDKVVKVLDRFLDNNDSVEIKGKNYTVKNDKVIVEALRTTSIKDNIITLVVNDDLVKHLELTSVYFNVNFVGNNKDEVEKQFVKIFNDFRNGKVDYDEAGFVNGTTKQQVYAENKGTITTILFVGIYLGIVFLISSMAVLALQQLSEARDSIDRYKALRKLGANDKMINKTIFIQTLIYFTLPIGLAFVHAVVGIKVANDFIAMYNSPNIGVSSLIAALVFILVYLGYFYSTYIGYKNIIKNS
jgi:putative ABC transport system permease protein